MAEAPQNTLKFDQGCIDCGSRTAELPWSLPSIDDDFDWDVRDYDSFRLFMMEELAHRFPERRRWAAADMEVVIVECLAAALDRLSHALDTIHRERFLESAKRPESVRRLLKQIGYDALEKQSEVELDAKLLELNSPLTGTHKEKLERFWRRVPRAMEEARIAGPLQISEQRRMITLEDYATVMVSHPLVEHAQSNIAWTGSWHTIFVATLLLDNMELDTPMVLGGPSTNRQVVAMEQWEKVTTFHSVNSLPLPEIGENPTPRRIIRELVDGRRMIGTDVRLVAPLRVPLMFDLSAVISRNHFKSEVEAELRSLFSASEGGFFEVGNRGFGEDLFASDIIEAAIRVEGVQTVCLNAFRRLDKKNSNEVDSGVLPIAEDEIAMCLNDAHPDQGYFRISINGGLSG